VSPHGANGGKLAQEIRSETRPVLSENALSSVSSVSTPVSTAVDVNAAAVASSPPATVDAMHFLSHGMC
jgi:hypothetical protein